MKTTTKKCSTLIMIKILQFSQFNTFYKNVYHINNKTIQNYLIKRRNNVTSYTIENSKILFETNENILSIKDLSSICANKVLIAFRERIEEWDLASLTKKREFIDENKIFINCIELFKFDSERSIIAVGGVTDLLILDFTTFDLISKLEQFSMNLYSFSNYLNKDSCFIICADNNIAAFYDFNIAKNEAKKVKEIDIKYELLVGRDIFARSYLYMPHVNKEWLLIGDDNCCISLFYLDIQNNFKQIELLRIYKGHTDIIHSLRFLTGNFFASIGKEVMYWNILKPMPYRCYLVDSENGNDLFYLSNICENKEVIKNDYLIIYGNVIGTYNWNNGEVCFLESKVEVKLFERLYTTNSQYFALGVIYSNEFGEDKETVNFWKDNMLENQITNEFYYYEIK